MTPFIVGAVVGFVQLVKSLFDRDYRSAVIIAGAALIGAIAGYFSIEGLTVSTGIVAGLLASGAVTVAQALGGAAINNK